MHSSAHSADETGYPTLSSAQPSSDLITGTRTCNLHGCGVLKSWISMDDFARGMQFLPNAHPNSRPFALCSALVLYTWEADLRLARHCAQIRCYRTVGTVPWPSIKVPPGSKKTPSNPVCLCPVTLQVELMPKAITLVLPIPDSRAGHATAIAHVRVRLVG